MAVNINHPDLVLLITIIGRKRSGALIPSLRRMSERELRQIIGALIRVAEAGGKCYFLPPAPAPSFDAEASEMWLEACRQSEPERFPQDIQCLLDFGLLRRAKSHLCLVCMPSRIRQRALRQRIQIATIS